MELFDEARILRRVGRERPAVLAHTDDLVALDRDFPNLPGLDIGKEFGESGRRFPRTPRGLLKQVEQGHQEEPDYDPQCEVLAKIAHGRALQLQI